MTEVTRYKTIATIAIAFSAGNLFTTACGGDGGLMGEANADDGDGDEQDISDLVSQVADLATALTATEAEVVALRSEVNSLNCFIGHMIDNYEFRDVDPTTGVDWQHIEIDDSNGGSAGWNQGMVSDSAYAYEDCF